MTNPAATGPTVPVTSGANGRRTAARPATSGGDAAAGDAIALLRQAIASAPDPPRPGAGGWAIRSGGLTKMYGALRAVDHLNLAVPAGAITGFVGPNGSGKTTTLRMLLGLVRPTEGTAEVLGASIGEPVGYLPRVGALIENPAFYPTLSGRRNLEVLAALGGHPRARAEEVLDVVELRERAGDPYRAYSMGMKQRLGVAAALLPGPELLILDEPTNGLDPAGIIETRAMLRGLRERGMTVFVSSHLLAELEQVADWLVLLQRGHLLFQGPIDELLARRRGALLAAGERESDLAVIAAVAGGLGHHATVADGRVRIDAPASAAAALNRAAMAAGVALSALGVERATLEETFLDIIGGS